MKIVIEHNGKQYNFQYGYEAYIFDCAISNDFDKTHTVDELKEFIFCVADCYLKDCNQTPLGYLTDFMAIHWNMLKRVSRYEILERFYNSKFYNSNFGGWE